MCHNQGWGIEPNNPYQLILIEFVLGLNPTQRKQTPGLLSKH